MQHTEKRLPHGVRRPFETLTSDLVRSGRMNDIRERAQDLDKLATQVFETADSEGRDLTATERARVESYLDERDEAMAGLAQRKRVEGVVDTLPSSAWGLPGGSSHPSNNLSSLDAVFGGDRGGFESIGQFFKAVDAGLSDPRLLKVESSMVGGTGSAGGFLVPEGFAREILGRAAHKAIVLPRAKVYAMEGQTLNVPCFDDLDSSDGTYFGGLDFQLVPEAGTFTRSDAKIRAIKLNCCKAGIFTSVSSELSADAGFFESLLPEKLGEAMARGMDHAFLRGTGAGQPIGVLNADSRITVEAEDGQAANTINMNNVLKMDARLAPDCENSAIWLAHPSTKPQLSALERPVGTGGELYDVLGGGAPSLRSKPVLFSELCSELGTEGDLMLVDLSKYAIGLRKNLRIERSDAVSWTEDLIDWRAVMRFDGQPIWNSAYTPRHGSDTLSWCVTLEDR